VGDRAEQYRREVRMFAAANQASRLLRLGEQPSV
jgi:hypothetical protein